MPMRFAIVDDDISIRKIIRNIIEEHGLGTVVVESADGLVAEKAIIESRPDIAIVDLLLPGQDGVELIKRLQELPLSPALIMISESRSQPMITEAYQQGIEFYIHKPINVLELITIIKKVRESHQLKKTISLISQATAPYSSPGSAPPAGEYGQNDFIYKAFSDLGIISEAGVKHIYQLTQMIAGGGTLTVDLPYQLNEKYQLMAQSANLDTKTIEQRVRRAIAKGLQNLANLGVEDYYNDRFQTYSTALFDFSEVRQEMNFVQGKSPYHGKINVKKFIEGLIFLATTKRLP
ncbi:MAG: response regulator [Negativicutes bacterium]|nr:response regulator [Negativicutes bacterium]